MAGPQRTNGGSNRQLATPQQQQQMVKQQDDRFKSVQTLFNRMEKQFEAALPRHMTVSRLLRVGLTACRANPKLLECDVRSLAAAMMACAQTGLEPDGILGNAYLVPFWSGKDRCLKVQFIAGYKGLMELMRRTGKVTTIQPAIVRARDRFEINYGPGGRIDHSPCFADVPENAPDTDPEEMPADMVKVAGPWIGAYGWFKFAGSDDLQWLYMTRSEIIAIRNGSSGWKSFKEKNIPTPWNTNPIPMAMKTALRRLANYAPRSPELAKAVTFDEADDLLTTDLGAVMDVIPVTDARPRSEDDLVPQDEAPPEDVVAPANPDKETDWAKRLIATKDRQEYDTAWNAMNEAFGGNVPATLMTLASETEKRLGIE